ncbi:MAG: hypothetical protein WAX69_03320 [Victivallales bacterium]
MEIDLSKLKNSEIFFIGFAVGFIPDWTRLNKFEDNMDCVDGDIFVLKKIIRKTQDILQIEGKGDVGIAGFLKDLGDINVAVASNWLPNTDTAIQFLKQYDVDNPVFKMGKRFAEHYPVYLGVKSEVMHPRAPGGNFFKWHFDEFKIPYVEKEEDTRFAENYLEDRQLVNISNILVFTDKIMELLNNAPLVKYRLHYEISMTNAGRINKKTPVKISIQELGFTAEPIGYDSFIRLIVLCLASNKFKGLKREQEAGEKAGAKLKTYTFENDINLADVFSARNSIRDTINVFAQIAEFHKDGRIVSGERCDNGYTHYRIDSIDVDENELGPFVNKLASNCKVSANDKPLKIPRQLLR